MYLPQLTSGPGSVSFGADGRSVVYSMQGSLWRQALDSNTAEQLTAGPGYDYQPDVSPDGKRIVFARYHDDAIELMLLDSASNAITPLTAGKAVNVEPRWSPDGRRLAWVSTQGTGRFHVFIGDIDDQGRLTNSAQAWPERRSRATRYYYSPFDHELSPTWSPDGKELIYVGNPEIVYGTGSIWRRALTPAAEPIAIRIEETTWKARPDWSPDGKRVLYSSYAGRQWHNIWITTAASGGDPLPLTYGDFDATGVRWSPDGARFAFISNANGNNGLWIQETPGGARRKLAIGEKKTLQPLGTLQLRILDRNGEETPARVSIVGADGRAYAPDDVWIHADDGFDRRASRVETQYFHTHGRAQLQVPGGPAPVTVWKGLEHRIGQRTVQIKPGTTTQSELTVQPLPLPPGWANQWRSADVHTHLNYGGTYRATPASLVRQASAEDLDIVFNLIVNKEQRIPDIGLFSPLPDAASTHEVLISHGQEFHTSYWGHLGLLGLNDHVLLPDYSAYPNTAAASLYPTNGAVADLAHAQKALVGYVHPFDELPDPKAKAPLTNALPVDVARGKIDYYEVVGFSDHRTSAAVWYRLMNCGFKLPAAAGTDAMTNFASLRGPVGMNRVYALVGPPLEGPGFKQPRDGGTSANELSSRASAWLEALRAGRTLATNAPLLGLSVEGQSPGADIAIERAGAELNYTGFLRSIAPIDHLELVVNGKVVRTIPLDRTRTQANFSGKLKAPESGWLLVRAWNDNAHPMVFDLYPYGTTNPVFFRAPGATTHCGTDAQYFLDWIDRLESAAALHEGYNATDERDTVLTEIRDARRVFNERR